MRIGIDLGGTSITGAVVDEQYHILAKKTIPTRRARPSTAIIADMGRLALSLMDQLNLTVQEITCLGIGSPGILDKHGGIVIYSNNFDWHHIDLRGEISQYIARPVFLENDANCAVLGESLAGAARGVQSVVMITLGTGVGGGIILGKQLYSGFNQAANVIGHTTLISGGEVCTCGRRGCFECYASVTALIRIAEQEANHVPDSMLHHYRRQDGELTGKNIFDAAKQGDPCALKVLELYFFYIAEGITNVINVLQPEAVVIGGALSNEGEYLLQPIRQHVRQDVYCKEVALPQISAAQLGGDAGVIGAAFLKEYQ